MLLLFLCIQRCRFENMLTLRPQRAPHAQMTQLLLHAQLCVPTRYCSPCNRIIYSLHRNFAANIRHVIETLSFTSILHYSK